MTPRRIVVLGGGVAGCAAALTARRLGANVTLVHAHAGATSLATGALDDVPWEVTDARPAPSLVPSGGATPLDEASLRVLEELAIYHVGDEVFGERGRRRAPAQSQVAVDEGPASGRRSSYLEPPSAAPPIVVATTAGILRKAAGIDASVLNLGGVDPGIVFVPAADHPSWNGALARSFDASALATQLHIEFVAITVGLTCSADERHMGDADLAALHDDRRRLLWLGEQLRNAVAATNLVPSAVLLPPWLGAVAPRALDLSDIVGIPCGEALGQPGGPAGLRFEHARDRALADAGVSVVAMRAVGVGVATAGERWIVRGIVRGSDGEAHDESLEADAVVLALGGLIGGGMAYARVAPMGDAGLPNDTRPAFQLTIDAPAVVGLGGKPLGIAASLFGQPPEVFLRGEGIVEPLERAGLLAGEDGHASFSRAGLYVAGDLVADGNRTWLSALRSGARAGAACCRK